LDTLIRDFPSAVRWEAVLGNSLIQAPLWIQQNPSHVGTFDVVHVDGGHSVECIVGDLATAVILTRPGGRIIVDDLQSEVIRNVLNMWLRTGVLTPDLQFQCTSYYPHVVLRTMV
jgi:precorrin-6B methylase 2